MGADGFDGVIIIVYTSLPAYEQKTFRGRNDDGSEAAATWKATAGTDWSQVGVSLFRARFLVKCTGLGEAGVQWSFNHRIDTGGGFSAWAATTVNSINVQVKDSAFLTAGADTTQQIGAGAFTSDNNGVVETTEGDAMTAVVDEEFELEGVFKIGTPTGPFLKPGDKVQIRVMKDLAVIGTYTLTPTITLAAPVQSADRLPMMGVS